jgi:hypothetical protein
MGIRNSYSSHHKFSVSLSLLQKMAHHPIGEITGMNIWVVCEEVKKLVL